VINIERGLGRIGMVLLSFCVVLILAILSWIATYGTLAWLNWPTILGVVSIYCIGFLFLIILLWQLFRWVLRGFHSH
jgi:hypothetical protein